MVFGSSIVRIVGASVLLALFACGKNVEPAGAAGLQKAVQARGKPLVVNHWATWCKPCVEEMPYFARAAKRFEGKVDFLGISWDLMVSKESPKQVASRVASFSSQYDVPFDSLLADVDEEELGVVFNLESLVIPQTHLYDSSGKRVASFEALQSEEDFEQFVKAVSALAR